MEKLPYPQNYIAIIDDLLVHRYILYSDTSKTHAGSALWQIQNGKPRLIGYGGKSLPKACAKYGIT